MKAYRTTLFLAALCGALIVPQSAMAQDWIYRARQGDTLWDLCIKYSNKRGCWIELGTYNKIANDRAIPLGTEIRFPQNWLLQMPVVGKVVYVQGEVSYDANASGQLEPLRPGQPLLLGSRILALEGTAKITLGKPGVMVIRPNTELRLDSLSGAGETSLSAEITLQQGDVEVEVQPGSRSRFEIRTPSAIAAVRGTEYRVSSHGGDGESTRSEVLTGAVEVKGMDSALVPAGFGVLARQGEPLDPPRKLLSPPVFTQATIDAPLPVDIHWQSDPLAVGWQLDLLQNGTLVESRRLVEPRVVLNDIDEGCYQLVLRAIDAAGFNGLEAGLPVCVLPPEPVVPVVADDDGPGLLVPGVMAAIFLAIVLL